MSDGGRLHSERVTPYVIEVSLDGEKWAKARIAESPYTNEGVVATTAFISEAADITDEAVRYGPDGTKASSTGHLVWYGTLDMWARSPCTVVYAEVPTSSFEEMGEVAIVMLSTLALMRREKMMKRGMRGEGRL